ncbi:hypothetical protein JRO89_XS07G0130100 [Xanthoceras sorbifolium]|uniref:Uncharacterized protein n=1 Tax=Xanthoceras sorbifolium TaxID=99658 RepID=A0ABQ8HTM7_9ROSI|nr:hypothetical protein JRO89_XS07G0130100 [Xanthoceras sorbifolium]
MEVFSELVATERDAEKLTVADSVSTNLKVAEIGSIPVVIRDMGVAVGEAILVEEVSKGAADVSLPGDSNTVCGIGSVVSSNSFGLPNACDQEDGTEIQVVNSPRRKAWKRLARGVSSVKAQSSSGGSNLGKRSLVLADDDEDGQQLKRGKGLSGVEGILSAKDVDGCLALARHQRVLLNCIKGEENAFGTYNRDRKSNAKKAYIFT